MGVEIVNLTKAIHEHRRAVESLTRILQKHIEVSIPKLEVETKDGEK